MAKEIELKCQLAIRLPVALASDLKEVTAHNRRSINNQITFYIEQGLEKDMKELGIEAKAA